MKEMKLLNGVSIKQVAGIIGALFLGSVLGIMFTGGGGTPTGGAGAETEHSSHEAGTTWTCSMHPQIQQPKPGKCPICGMNLIPLKKGAGKGLRPRELKMSAAAKALARITTVPVRRQLIDAEINMVGKIDYDETRKKTVAAWFPSRIDRLYVDYTGIEVKKGDHLAQVYSPELLTAQQELLSAIKFGA